MKLTSSLPARWRATTVASSIDGAGAMRAIEREGGNVDVEIFACRRHHAVSSDHETRWRRQRHAAGIFKALARCEHGLFAYHARAAHFLHASLRVGNVPIAGLQLHRFRAEVGNLDGIGPEKMPVLRRGPLGKKARRGRDLDIASDGTVHQCETPLLRAR